MIDIIIIIKKRNKNLGTPNELKVSVSYLSIIQQFEF